MSTKLKLGESGEGTATTAAIGAGLGVKYDASNPGALVVTGVGDRIIGVTQEAIPQNTTGTFWKPRCRAYVSGSGVAAGDLVKCAAAGAFTTESTATTPTVYTVGQAMTASDSSNFFDCQFF